MIRRRVTGLFASLAIIGLLAGLPSVLLAVGFDAVPRVRSWSEVVDLLLSPDDGTLALTALTLLGWVTWAVLTVLILAEIIAQLRGRRAPNLRGLHLPQSLASHLVAAAAALFIALPSGASTAVATPTLPAPAAATATQTPGRDTPASDRTVQVREATPATRPHTVKRGESLWSIAHTELGNPRRYTEIAALNSALLDGRGDGFLSPGWTLHLPADPARTAPSLGRESATYVVGKGDTLSDIALEELGDASAYPDIFEASRAITQPGGRHLTDPDVIDVGWTLALPTGTADVEPDDVTVQPGEGAPTPGPDGEVGSAPVAPMRADVDAIPSPNDETRAARADTVVAPARAADNQTDSEASASDVDLTPVWQVAGLVGAGTILGGSMWLALRRRRAARTRARRPGRMIAAPPATLTPIDKTLDTSGVSAAPSVELLHDVLLRLAATQAQTGRAMPAVAAVEFADTHLTLHLGDGCELGQPWQQAPDQHHWRLARDVPLDEVGPVDAAMPAPYPQLVSIGTDNRSLWLLNLESVGVLSLTGEPTRAADFARYIAAEVAVNPWSRDVAVECVGVAHEIVALNPRRVRHHASDDVAAELLTDTVAMIDRANEARLDVSTGRASLADQDLWDSRLLLIDAGGRTDVTGQLARLVRDHPHRSGAAVVLIGDTDADEGDVIRLTPDGRLQMPGVGLELIAVGLTGDEAAGCAALFAQADEAGDVDFPGHLPPADGWQAHSNQAGQLRPEVTVPRGADAAVPVASLLPEIDDVYLTIAATTAEDLARLAPQVPVSVRDAVVDADPKLEGDLAAWFDPHCDLPRLTLLGPLTVRVAPTGKPIAAATRKAYMTELVAYLATRAHGATTGEVAEAMNIPVDRVRKDILAIRSWLGLNPRTGRPHIPDSRYTAAAEVRGQAAYQIESILVDADLFRRLRVRGEARGPDGIADLDRALSLVTGTPLAHVRKDGGAWLTEGDRLDHILLCAVVDVAHLLSVASLQQGDHAGAQAAAEIAAQVAPYEEIPQLDLAAALAARGHRAVAAQVLHENVTNRSDSDDRIPDDLPSRSGAILDSHNLLTWRDSASA